MTHEFGPLLTETMDFGKDVHGRPYDLVEVLRLWSENAKDQGSQLAVEGLDAAADEIERLREELTASHESHGNEVGALTERLSLAIHERDEARREVCGLLVACHIDPDDEKPDPNLKNVHAGIRGWDCFKEAR